VLESPSFFSLLEFTDVAVFEVASDAFLSFKVRTVARRAPLGCVRATSYPLGCTIFGVLNALTLAGAADTARRAYHCFPAGELDEVLSRVQHEAAEEQKLRHEATKPEGAATRCNVALC
jgi:hypothetical protein